MKLKLGLLIFITVLTGWPAGTVTANADLALPSGPAAASILLHNRMGMRIEFNLQQQALEIWISPRAGKSLDYRDRNFSNRDDHTVLFDQIHFPNLSAADFVHCDEDPFQPTLVFKKQKLQLINLFSQPALALWFEKPETVDFKSDKQDRLLKTAEKIFAVEHPDRERLFHYYAQLSAGKGCFSLSPWNESGRSLYSRARCDAGQLLIITGGLADEAVDALADRLASTTLGDLITQNERALVQVIQAGAIQVRDRPDLQKYLDAHRALLVSLQDASGALRSSSDRRDYLIAHREASQATVWSAYSGWVNPLTQWCGFQLANPALSKEEPGGKFFGRLVAGPLSGRQEDGIYYAIWSAFTHWTQTGSRRAIPQESLQLLEQAMNWLERYCYDPKQNAFGRFYAGNQPLTASLDYGWNSVCGGPAATPALQINGKIVNRSYDLYINQLAFAGYLMLAALQSGDKSEAYANQADKLEKFFEPYYKKSGALPAYGALLDDKGKKFQADPFALSPDDYLFALSGPLFYSDYPAVQAVREKTLPEVIKRLPELSTASALSFLSAVDPVFQNEQNIAELFNAIMTRLLSDGSTCATRFTPDAAGDGKVRPAAAPSGALLAAVSNMGLRRLPFGLAVRSNRVLSRLSQYEYKGRLLEIRYEGQGAEAGLQINGQRLAHTLQVPEAALQDGVNEVTVLMNSDPPEINQLVYSTVRLEQVRKQGAELTFEIECYGKNVLIFTRLTGQVKMRSADGATVPVLTEKKGPLTFIECFGRDRMTLAIKN